MQGDAHPRAVRMQGLRCRSDDRISGSERLHDVRKRNDGPYGTRDPCGSGACPHALRSARGRPVLRGLSARLPGTEFDAPWTPRRPIGPVEPRDEQGPRCDEGLKVLDPGLLGAETSTTGERLRRRARAPKPHRSLLSPPAS
jgi:hypothetical protein